MYLTEWRLPFCDGLFLGCGSSVLAVTRRLQHRRRLYRRLYAKSDLSGSVLRDTGHAEAVRIVLRPSVISYEQLLQVFWENHDPAQGMRQGNDHGTQYRSAIYPLTPEQDAAARASLERFQAAMLAADDDRRITTEIANATPFYYAEDDHQQYLHKNPYGYCGIGGIGVCLPPEA